MRRIAVYRGGNQIAAQIGPDLVQGIAGFGSTVAALLDFVPVLRELPKFDAEGCDFVGLGPHSLRRSNITWRQEVGGSSIEASGSRATRPSG